MAYMQYHCHLVGELWPYFIKERPNPEVCKTQRRVLQYCINLLHLHIFYSDIINILSVVHVASFLGFESGVSGSYWLEELTGAGRNPRCRHPRHKSSLSFVFDYWLVAGKWSIWLVDCKGSREWQSVVLNATNPYNSCHPSICGIIWCRFWLQNTSSVSRFDYSFRDHIKAFPNTLPTRAPF